MTRSDLGLALAIAQEFKDRSERAEAYLDQCVAKLQNIDIATMRRLLRGTERSDAAND